MSTCSSRDVRTLSNTHSLTQTIPCFCHISSYSSIDRTLVHYGTTQRKANRKADQNEMNRFSVNDYHNPEGQHRNYARNLRSLPKNLERSGDETFDPIAAATNDGSERAGAKRLANEMKRRIEKQQNKRQKIEFEQTDVSHINQRNQRFNQKISRTYDKATAEIRQNLERGTAL